MKITLYQPTLSLLLLLLLCGGCAVNQEKGKTITPQASPLAEIVPWQTVRTGYYFKSQSGSHLCFSH
jgi:hypothetical protein